jgi:hypothetical protein
MNVNVALLDITGNKGEIITVRTPMPQERWPHITTSISGISAEDWTSFKSTANKRDMTYREAIEHAVADLVADIRSGRSITWRPTRSARSRAIKIHAETVDQVRILADQVGYRQNVIFGTAMHRWVAKH